VSIPLYCPPFLRLSSMNSIILVIGFILFVTGDGFGRIKNGYTRQIQATKSALHTLKSRLAVGNELSVRERRQLEADMLSLITYISCYQLTEELIARLKRISPAIFRDIDNIEDSKGRPTDVYIKLVPYDKARVNLKAATFVSQATGDPDASCSEYGPFSLSVDICISDNALFLLSHELGHIKYIVPNLAAYKEFYARLYGRVKSSNLPYIGHGDKDQSGRTARQYEKIYRQDIASYRKNLAVELQGFVGLFSRLKKMHGNMDTHHDNAFAHLY
jgi:hypothetical protein